MNFDYSRFKFSIEIASNYFAIKSDIQDFDCWKLFENTAEKYCILHNHKFYTNHEFSISIEGTSIDCRFNDNGELVLAHVDGWDIQLNKEIRDIIYRTKKLFGIPVFAFHSFDEDFVNNPTDFDVSFLTEETFNLLSSNQPTQKNDYSNLIVSLDKFIDIIKNHEGETFIDRVETLSETHKKLYIGHKPSSQRDGTVIIDTIELEENPILHVIDITIVGDNLDILTELGKGWPSYIFNEAAIFEDSYLDGDGHHCFRFKYNNPTFRSVIWASKMNDIMESPESAALLLNYFLTRK